MLASFPVQVPTPGASHDSGREHRNALSLQRTMQVLDAMISAFDQFEPLNIYDASGLVLQVLARRAGRDFNVGRPYQIFDAGTVPSDALILVHLHSHLLNSIEPDDNLVISGLNQSFQVNSDDYIYMEIEIGSGGATGATMMHGPAWDGYPVPVKFDGTDPATKQQTKAYVEIGYCVSSSEISDYDPPGIIIGPGNASITVVQNVQTHMLMAQTCYKGDTVWYPIPWWGASHVGDT